MRRLRVEVKLDRVCGVVFGHNGEAHERTFHRISHIKGKVMRLRELKLARERRAVCYKLVGHNLCVESSRKVRKE